jgi:hypothetical protein
VECKLQNKVSEWPNVEPQEYYILLVKIPYLFFLCSRSNMLIGSVVLTESL